MKPSINSQSHLKRSIKASLLAFAFFAILPLHAEEKMDKQEAPASPAKQCPDYLNVEFRKLHSEENINLCKIYHGKPLLIVNTASHCGFTPQFKELEALYQRYKAKGFEVVGFASDDFNQEASTEEKAAGICYKNYGVTFTMLAPTKVKGKDANPTFLYLAQQTRSPSWNFNKYLVVPASTSVTHYDSKTKPLDSALEEDVKKYIF